MNFFNEYKKQPDTNDKVKQFFYENKLAKRGMYEKSEELFKPIIDQQIKQNETIEKQLTNLNHDNQIARIDNNNDKPIFENPNISLVNLSNNPLPNSLQFYQNNNNGKFYLNNKEVEHNKESDEFSFKNSNKKYPVTRKLIALLGNDNLENYSVNNEEDLENLKNYHNLLIEAKSSKRAGRFQSLNKKLLNFNSGSGLIVLPNDKNQLWERLKILLAGKKEGHNNSLEEITGILDQLLKMKEITIEEYKKFSV